jgi:hypothetical protein
MKCEIVYRNIGQNSLETRFDWREIVVYLTTKIGKVDNCMAYTIDEVDMLHVKIYNH